VSAPTAGTVGDVPAEPAVSTPPPPTTTPTTTTTTTTVPTRKVQGTAVTLGPGSFTGGTDVVPGLYDVTTGTGQSGRFVVTGADRYNDILDSSGTKGVPEIRVQISTGDLIRIWGLADVMFAPVSTPFVTTHSAVTLFAGTWTVGQDLGPGRYVATPGAGQSGKFVIKSQGVDKLLGGDPRLGGVPSLSFAVKNGDVIEISGLAQVALAPS
jgi:hypothetical protein